LEGIQISRFNKSFSNWLSNHCRKLSSQRKISFLLESLTRLYVYDFHEKSLISLYQASINSMWGSFFHSYQKDSSDFVIDEQSTDFVRSSSFVQIFSNSFKINSIVQVYPSKTSTSSKYMYLYFILILFTTICSLNVVLLQNQIVHSNKLLWSVRSSYTSKSNSFFSWLHLRIETSNHSKPVRFIVLIPYNSKAIIRLTYFWSIIFFYTKMKKSTWLH